MDATDKYPYHPPKPNVSLTQKRVLDTCPRRWFYEYAPDDLYNRHLLGERKWSFRTEKKLFENNMLTGIVVDTTIELAFRSYKAKPDKPFSPNLVTNGGVILDEYVEHSRKWSTAAHTPYATRPGHKFVTRYPERIFHGNDYTDDEVQVIREYVTQHLAAFAESAVLKRLLAYDRDCIVVQPRGQLPNGDNLAFPWFWSVLPEGRVPVYASYDLLVIAPPTALILDWKTGDPLYEGAQEDAFAQLNGYVPFVLQEYPNVDVDEIEIITVWLRDLSQTVSMPVDLRALDSAKVRWADQHKDVSARLDACRRNLADIDIHFPFVTDEDTCGKCKFHYCERNPKRAPDAVADEAEYAYMWGSE